MRAQAASLFAAPFAMRFKAGGLAAPRDLLRCHLPDWGLRGPAEGDGAFARAVGAAAGGGGPDEDDAEGEGGAARAGGVGEYRFQIEAMLRVLVGAEEARAGASGIFAYDGPEAAAFNARVAKAEALLGLAAPRHQGPAGPAGRQGLVAGYGRPDPLAKQVNPFLGPADRLLVKRGNANGMRGFEGASGGGGARQPGAVGAGSTGSGGPVPQRKLAFDPRYQRAPWDPAGKMPRARSLGPTRQPPTVLKVDWDKEDGVPNDRVNDGSELLLPGAGPAAPGGGGCGGGGELDVSELPPPAGQTFDEAERLEALRDLPPSLWSAAEYVPGAYGSGGAGGADGRGGGGADRFEGLWPNTGERHTKVRLGDGTRDVSGRAGPRFASAGVGGGGTGGEEGGGNGLSGDPAAPDPRHPDVSADYRKPGSAVFGVAAQSRITHPAQVYRNASSLVASSEKTWALLPSPLSCLHASHGAPNSS